MRCTNVVPVTGKMVGQKTLGRLLPAWLSHVHLLLRSCFSLQKHESSCVCFRRLRANRQKNCTGLKGPGNAWLQCGTCKEHSVSPIMWLTSLVNVSHRSCEFEIPPAVWATETSCTRHSVTLQVTMTDEEPVGPMMARGVGDQVSGLSRRVESLCRVLFLLAAPVCRIRSQCCILATRQDH